MTSRIFLSVIILTASLISASAFASAYQVELTCVGGAVGAIISGRQGSCTATYIDKNGYPGKETRNYNVLVLGLGAAMNADAGVFGFHCRTELPDDHWLDNVTGVYYGSQGSVSYVVGGHIGAFARLHDSCELHGLHVGIGYDFSAGILVILPQNSDMAFDPSLANQYP